MFSDITGSITRPYRKEVPLTDLLLYMGLFLILAWIAYDMLRILSTWMASAAPQ